MLQFWKVIFEACNTNPCLSDWICVNWLWYLMHPLDLLTSLLLLDCHWTILVTLQTFTSHANSLAIDTTDAFRRSRFFTFEIWCWTHRRKPYGRFSTALLSGKMLLKEWRRSEIMHSFIFVSAMMPSGPWRI